MCYRILTTLILVKKNSLAGRCPRTGGVDGVVRITHVNAGDKEDGPSGERVPLFPVDVTKAF